MHRFRPSDVWCANRRALSALLLLAAASPAWADLIGVSNRGEPLVAEFNVAQFAHAEAFTTGTAANTLTGVTISAFSNNSGTSGLRLRSDAAGTPGALLENLGTRAVVAGSSAPTYTSIGSALLPNTTYWLTLGEAGSGSGDFQWDGTTSTAQTSTLGWTIADQALISSNGGTTWQAVNFGPPNESLQFAVNVAGVPEPGSLALAAVAAAGAAWRRLRLRRAIGQLPLV